MISKKLSTPGHYIGTNVNYDRTHVLLQIGDDTSQTRIRLTIAEVDKLLIELETRKNQLIYDIKPK